MINVCSPSARVEITLCSTKEAFPETLILVMRRRIRSAKFHWNHKVSSSSWLETPQQFSVSRWNNKIAPKFAQAILVHGSCRFHIVSFEFNKYGHNAQSSCRFSSTDSEIQNLTWVNANSSDFLNQDINAFSSKFSPCSSNHPPTISCIAGGSYRNDSSTVGDHCQEARFYKREQMFVEVIMKNVSISLLEFSFKEDSPGAPFFISLQVNSMLEQILHNVNSHFLLEVIKLIQVSMPKLKRHSLH
jgi:hypothetical protein